MVAETRMRLFKTLSMVAIMAVPAIAAQGTRPAMALDTDGPPVIESPVDDFNKQLEEVKKSFGALGGKIEQSTKDIEKLTTPGEARKEIGALQGMIADALGSVSDNGGVAKLGQKALDFARSKQRQFEADAKFSPEERQYLLNEWRRIGGEIERANNDLGNARQEFSQLLRTVQTRGDYIEELRALNNAQKMLEVIRMLAGDIRTASDAMKSFISKVTPPSPGT
jgi:phage shock protein A